MLNYAIVGMIGAGKRALGAALAEAVEGDHVSLPDVVMGLLRANPSFVPSPRPYGDQKALQDVVVRDPGAIVDAVMRWHVNQERPLVVSGLRHVELLLYIGQRLDAVRQLAVVYLDTPDDRRDAVLRGRGVLSPSRRLLESDVAEEQVPRILRQYAWSMHVVNGAWPLDLQVRRIITS